jgi:hypothetical protein
MDPSVNQSEKAKSDGVDPPPEHTIDIKPAAGDAAPPPPALSDQKSTVPSASIALYTDSRSATAVLASAKSNLT